MNLSMLTLVFLVLSSSEPQSSTGTIRGTVTSKSTGERIVHAEVSLYLPTFTTYTDSNGVFRLAKVLAGEYSLTISAPGHARLTFRGLVIPEFTPLVLDARLSEIGSPDSVIVMKYVTSTLGRTEPHDKMRYYQPDSTIDYKIRIVNPEARLKGPRSFSIPDTLLKHK